MSEKLTQMCRQPTDAVVQNQSQFLDSLIKEIHLLFKTKISEDRIPDLIYFHGIEDTLVDRIGPIPYSLLIKNKKTLYFCLERVIHNLAVYAEFCLIQGFKIRSKNKNILHGLEAISLIHTAMSWLLLDVQGLMEDYIKFHTSYLFAKYGKQRDLPQSNWSHPGVFMYGSWKYFIRNISHEKKRIQDFFTLMQWKRGCAPLRVGQVVDNLVKHQKLMTSTFETPNDLVSIVREVSQSIGKRASYMMEKPLNVPAPSTSACYEKNNAQGGSKKYIYDFLDTKNSRSDKAAFAQVEVNMGGQYVADLDIGMGIKSLLESRQYVDETFVKLFDISTPAGVPSESFEKIELALFERPLDQSYKAAVVALPEPFKTRVITKSEALLNYYGKPLQKVLHKTISKTSWGFPIGRPISVQDVIGLANLKSDEFIVSGDYSSATDRLNQDVSVGALDAVLKELPISIDSSRILLRTLVGQYLVYEKVIDRYKDEPGFNEAAARLPPNSQQTNGQLMGSILSFPILCIVNAAVFLASAREYYNDSRLTLERAAKLHHLLINGDDILFKATDRFIQIWYKKVVQVGLIPSLGKNYVSNRFFTINSMLFVLEQNTVVYKPFLNAGLLYGQTPMLKPVGEAQVKFGDSCAAVQSAFMKGYEPRGELIDLWIHRNADSLRKADLGRNWFIPKILGGLGLFTTREIVVNKCQARAATFVATRSTPEQLFESKFSLGLIKPTASAVEAQKIIKSLGKDALVFGGKSLDDFDMFLQSLDPYGKGDVLTEKDILAMTYRGFRKLTKLSNQLGNLEPMSVSKMMAYQVPEVGLSRDFTFYDYRNGIRYHS